MLGRNQCLVPTCQHELGILAFLIAPTRVFLRICIWHSLHHADIAGHKVCIGQRRSHMESALHSCMSLCDHITLKHLHGMLIWPQLLSIPGHLEAFLLPLAEVPLCVRNSSDCAAPTFP